MEEPLHLTIRCPNCGARALLLDPATGEVVCQRCGAVVRERIADESGGEKRAGDPGERAGRDHRGPPITLTRHDMGLSTVIAEEDRDASGAALGPEVRSLVHRLRLWDGRAQRESAGGDLMSALDLLDIISGKLGLPRAAAERAAMMYRRAREMGLLRGRASNPLVAASVLAATRELGIPRRIVDVAAAAGLRKHDVYRAYRLLRDAGIARVAATQAPEAFVARAASAAGLPEAVARRALGMIREARASRPGAIAGRDPVGLAGAAVYAAAKLTGAGDRLTQRDVALALGVTEATIRKGVHGLGYRFDREARAWVKVAEVGAQEWRPPPAPDATARDSNAGIARVPVQEVPPKIGQAHARFQRGDRARARPRKFHDNRHLMGAFRVVSEQRRGPFPGVIAPAAVAPQIAEAHQAPHRVAIEMPGELPAAP